MEFNRHHCKAKILPNQTMNLDYWLIKFIETDGVKVSDGGVNSEA
jgi:hypothetical protein